MSTGAVGGASFLSLLMGSNVWCEEWRRLVSVVVAGACMLCFALCIRAGVQLCAAEHVPAPALTPAPCLYHCMIMTWQVRSEWVWRRRKAVALLIFGLVSGITCTDAILGAVKEEAAVVQLAQQLVAHEVVVVETTRAQKKAKEAVAAVSVVQTASAQLDAAQANATSTLGKLQEAANALSSIAHHNTSGEVKHAWDITGVIKVCSRQRQQWMRLCHGYRSSNGVRCDFPNT